MGREMIFAVGIDSGSYVTKVIILDKQGTCIYKNVSSSGGSSEEDAVQALKMFCEGNSIELSDLNNVIATGTGRENISFAKKKPLIVSLARGARKTFPQARTVVDVGAESSTIVILDEKGIVDEFYGTGKCASGTGTFLQSMAKLIEMDYESMSDMARKSRQPADITSTCSVFSEQEVISHIHREPPTPLPDLLAGIYLSMAKKMASFVRNVNYCLPVVLCGGMAKNQAFIDMMQREMKIEFLVPPDTEYMGALGASLFALDEMEAS